MSWLIHATARAAPGKARRSRGKTRSHPADAHLVALLREREMRVERSVNDVRAGLYLAFVVLDLVTAVRSGIASSRYVAVVLGGSALAVPYLLLVHVLSGPSRFRGWLKYFTISVDFSLLAGYLEEMHRSGVTVTMSADALAGADAMVASLLIMVSALRLSRWAVLYATSLAVGFTICATALWSGGGVSGVWSVPLVVLAGAVTSWVSGNVGRIARRLWQRERLARFLPRDLVKIVESSETDVVLGGRAAPVTVMFADIRGFTLFCEDRDAGQIVSVLNRYFTAMTAAIQARGGMIDKFIGDGLMAVFGAPLPTGNDAANAVAAARSMLAALEDLNRGWQDEGLAPLAIGIALHTGVAVVGNIGSPERMDYTVIGDTVNLAARIEEKNKVYHTRVLLSEATVLSAGPMEGLRPVGEVEIRGRREPVRLYSLDASLPTASR